MTESPVETVTTRQNAFSVTLPYYNEADFLGNTILSWLNQSRKPDQIILVDNGSTDGSEAVAREVLKDIDSIEVKFLHELRPGKLFALETGCNAVTCEFVALSDADTYYPPHYLELCEKLFADSNNKISALMALPEFDSPHALCSRLRRWYLIGLSKVFKKHTFTGGYGQIFRIQALRQAGGFSEKIWPYVLLDHEIMFRIFKGVGDPAPFTVSQMPFFRCVISKVCRKNKVSRSIFKRGLSLYHIDLWCQSSQRRKNRRKVRWNLFERIVYQLTPYPLQEWFFYRFLGPRFQKRGLIQLQLRDKPWQSEKNENNQKFLQGGLKQWVSGSVGQWVSSMIGKPSNESLIMMPRPHPETNENQHKRFAQHIGSPYHGAPGRQRQKKVSCLMVTANRERFFKRSLLSYRRQTYPHKELIIIDDGDQDLGPLLKDLPAEEVKYLRIEKKPGNVLGYLRNRSLDNASGDFITQWDDDDWYHPDRLRIQVETLLQGYDACCLSNALMHIDVESFFHHPYIGFFKKGTPGSIMHRRDPSIRYPEIRRSEDDVYLRTWAKKRYIKLPASYAYLFIRCFHGANTWDMKHFFQQMRNTFPDLVTYGWYRFVEKDLFRHRRFILDEKTRAAFEAYLQDSYETGLFE
jgi:glycosyltransferase involved in cell wall biosynthesis